MPSFVTVTDDSAVTPGRESYLHLDTPETVLIEEGYTCLRQGAEVAQRSAQGTANASEHIGVKYWSSGVWTSMPLQLDLPNIHESESGNAYIVTKANWDFVQVQGTTGPAQDMFSEFQNFAQSTVEGASYGAGVPMTGDSFLKKGKPAGASYDPASVAGNTGFDSAMPLIAYQNTDVPMDRVAVTTSAARANQGVFLRWRAPGTDLSSMRYLFSFYFGQYAIVIGGGGYAELWEYCRQTIEGDPRWVQRKKWRYTQESLAAGKAHAIAIWPHISPTGIKYIGFAALNTAITARTNTAQRVAVQGSTPGEEIYKFDVTVRGSDVDESPDSVTASDLMRFDVRRDLSLSLQVSVLGWDENGVLIDDDGINGGGSLTGNTVDPTINLQAVIPTGASVTATVIDGSTQLPFVAGTDLFPAAKFVFTSDGTDTAMVWGYTIYQPPVVEEVEPGEFQIDATEYAINGYAGDPQTESATVKYPDLTMQFPRLQSRGEFSALITTSFTPPEADPVTVSLFRGIADGARGDRRGVPSGGYPADDWRDYTQTIGGMWVRLSEKVQGVLPRLFGQDPAVMGTVSPWKVTDALREIIMQCGFPSSQIDIPDLPYRLWPGYAGKGDDLSINPTANLGEFAVRMLRERLGAFLHFEPNAGSRGKWILIFGTQAGDEGTFDPVFNFSADLPVYWNGTTTIGYEHDESYTRKPDFNMVCVSTGQPTTDRDTDMRVTAFSYNPLSYRVAGMTTLPDPDHPDYISRLRAFLLIAPQLQCETYEDTIAAVRWANRRYFDFLCHAQRLRHISAPLAFIHDSSIATGSSSGGWRPLRYQDPVSVDGDAGYLIKSIKPAWSHTRVQMCDYELIRPFPGQTFFGADGSEHIRKAMRKMNARSSGLNVHSAQFSTFAPAAHREQAHLERPVVRHGFTRLQNADGSFIPMDGWNTWNGTSG